MKAAAETVRDWLLAPPPVVEPNPSSRAVLPRVKKTRRLSSSGHLCLSILTVCLAGASYLLAHADARQRIEAVGYCQQTAVKMQREVQPPLAALSILNSALPNATTPQRERLVQQGNELIALYTYHCRSLEEFSIDYQALLFVANGSAVVAATMLGLLSMYGVKGDIFWPFTILASSAFSLGLAVSSIQTFRLNSNLSASRNLLEQTNTLTRSFATSIANQSYADTSSTLNLNNKQELGTFLNTMDQRLKQVDIPIFTMNDSFAAKEVNLLLDKSTKPDAPSKNNTKE